MAKKRKNKKDLKYNPIYLQKRKGNGHKIQKTRDLSDKEKDYIRRKFINIKGQITYINNDCRKKFCSKIKKKLGPDISVFQVTGYVMRLHGQVKNGKINFSDAGAYKEFMEKHRSKWATYESSKYQDNIELYKLDKYKELTYINFIEFYKENFEDVERLIWKIARRYGGSKDSMLNAEELHSRLLLKLGKSTVLDEYVPEKAKLSSYLTERIIGYTRHIIAKQYSERSLPIPKKHMNSEEKKRRKKERYNVLVPLDIIDENGGMKSIDIPIRYNVESAITLREIKDFAKSKLTERQFKIFEMMIEDHTDRFMAKKIKRPVHYISRQKNIIRKTLQKTFSKGDI